MMHQYGTYTAQSTAKAPHGFLGLSRYMRRMSMQNDIFARRIAQRLKAMKMTERSASIAATGKPDTLRFVRTRGTMPSAAKILKIAAVLETDPLWLIGESDEDNFEGMRSVSNVHLHSRESALGKLIAFGANPTNAVEMGIPIFHADIGLPVNLESIGGGNVSINTTVLKNLVIDFAQTPPKFPLFTGMYGFFSQDDSMSPAFEKYSRMYLQPEETPAIGDYGAVRLFSDHELGTETITLGRIIGIQPDFLVVRQYTPAVTFRVPTAQVEKLLRVLNYQDLA